MASSDELLKELKRIRFMLEDIWINCEQARKHKLDLSILEERLKDEIEWEKYQEVRD